MSQQSSKSASLASNVGGCLVRFIFIQIFSASLFLIRSILDSPDPQNQARKAKQTEAKQYVSSMNKAQQAYFAEKSLFSSSVNALGLGIKTETTNYKYSLRTTKQTAFNYGVSKQPQLKSYVGGVFVIPAKKFESNTYNMGITTTSILCIADSPGTIKPAEPTNQNGKIACATGTIELKN